MAGQEETTALQERPMEKEEEGQARLEEERKKRLSTYIKLGWLALIVLLVLVLVLVVKIQDMLPDWLRWVEDNMAVGAFAYIAVYVAATVLLIPASFLSLAAGAIFKLWLGIVVVWTGATVGQTLAFLVGRYLLRDWVEGLAKKHPKWRAVDRALLKEGWKVILLVRLAPVLPYSAMNYILSISAVEFRAYAVMSAIGIIPGVLLFVYIGSLARNVSEVINGDRGIDGTAGLVTIVVSGVFILALIAVVGRMAKRAIAEHMVDEAEEPESSSPEPLDRPENQT